jgi:hypothetical protein
MVPTILAALTLHSLSIEKFPVLFPSQWKITIFSKKDIWHPAHTLAEPFFSWSHILAAVVLWGGVDITGSGTLGFLHGIGCSLKSSSRNWVWDLGGHWNLITAVEAGSHWKEVQDDALLGAVLTVADWDTPGWGGLVKLSKIELVENGRAGFAGPIEDVLALAGWDTLTALDWAVLEWGQTG